MSSKIKKLRRAWHNMLQRCNNPNCPDYKRYGQRGVKVRFHRFEHFARHIGLPPDEKMSVDRIDNNDDYRHGNIRWATAKEQAANRRGAKRDFWEQMELL